MEQLKVLRTTMRLSCGKGPNGHTGGFQKKKNTSNKSESGFIGSSSCRPAHTSAATELLRDAVAGMSFLSKMGNSSWWNWLLVSTLALAGGRTTSSISGRDGPLLRAISFSLSFHKTRTYASSRTGQVAFSTGPSGPQTVGCLRQRRPLEF